MTTVMCCGECGIEFHVPDHFYAERKKTGHGWYCPNGHSRAFKESDADKFRRERDRAVQEQARLAEENAEKDRQLAKKEGEIKRFKKRASAGTCPCCSRTFSNMTRHMQTKHPELVAENVVKLKVGKTQ